MITLDNIEVDKHTRDVRVVMRRAGFGYAYAAVDVEGNVLKEGVCWTKKQAWKKVRGE